jgi:hypothetical protein
MSPSDRYHRARRSPGLFLAVTLALVAVGAACSPAAADEWTAWTGVHLDAWSGAGQSGHQILAPLSLAFDTPFWGLSIRGAVGDSERDPGGNRQSGRITGFTDSTTAGYYRWAVADVEIRAGLNLDLPTGVSQLKTRDLAAIQDEDLALLERFGEGFDVNPTISAYRNFGRFGMGGGVGYLWTGEYDPTEDIPGDDLDPGDEFTGTALADVALADALRLVGTVTYTMFSADTLGGRDSFQEGDELDFRISLEWRPEPWWVAVTFRDIVRFKAERLNAAGKLSTEPFNSRGNDIRGSVVVGYIIDDVWTIQGIVEIKHVFANDYPESEPLFDGGRTKIAVGPTVTWLPHRRFGIEGGFRYFFMDVDRSPFFPQSGTINGVHADLRVLYRF